MVRVLVAEHHKDVAHFLYKKLKKDGYTIDVMDTALKAWRASSQNEYDLMLIDVEMPGIDGFVLAQRAIQKNNQIQIVFVTGFAAVAMDTRATPAFAPVPVTKRSFHLTDINAHVRYCLGYGSMPAEKSSAATENKNVIYPDFARKETCAQAGAR